MKKHLIAALLATSFINHVIAADVGVSVSIGQPGFYGHLDIGDYPAPRVIYAQPRIIEQRGMGGPPVYLRVPPGHARNWRKHCREYNACGEQVYFVKDDWYNREYAPRYREQHGEHKNDRNEDGRGNGHGNKGHERANH